MEDKMNDQISDWKKNTEAMMKQMSSFADGLMADLTEDEKKLVEAEMKKQKKAPLQKEMKKAISELNKALANIK